MKSDTRYYIVYRPYEVIFFKGTFEKQYIGGPYRWSCDISLGEAYNHTEKKYGVNFATHTCPIEISKEIYETLVGSIKNAMYLCGEN